MLNTKTYKDFNSIVNREGYIYIIISMIFTAISFIYMSSSLLIIGLVITSIIVYFFRDPIRYVPQSDNIILAPADGIITNICLATPPEETGIADEMQKISIFLSPLDVHINRCPISGTVKSVRYHQGKFFNATLDKSSIYNERNSIIIESMNNLSKIVVVQIAGLIARRIVCDLSPEQKIRSGERFGMIKFSSRVDIFIPKNIPIFVYDGQSCIAGETIIGFVDGSNKIENNLTINPI